MGEKSAVAGVGFLDLLALLFVGLKLGGVITWSWWWVLAPMWGPILLLFVVVMVLGILGLCEGFNV